MKTQILLTQEKWFLLQGESKMGPYSAKDIIEKLQNREIFEYNYLWAPPMHQWTMVSKIPEFSSKEIERLLREESPIKSIFKNRKSSRIEIHIPLMAHDNHLLFKGYTESVSMEGMKVLLETPFIVPGQKLLIHLDLETPFNFSADVIQKFVPEKRVQMRSALSYILRIQNIPEKGREYLKNLTHFSENKTESKAEKNSSSKTAF